MAREYFEKKLKFDTAFLLSLYAATIACVFYPQLKEAVIYIVCFPVLIYTLIVICITNGDISSELVAQSRYLKARRFFPTPVSLGLLLIPSLATCSAITVEYLIPFLRDSGLQIDPSRATFYIVTVATHVVYMLFGMRWGGQFLKRERPLRGADEEIIAAACRYYGFQKKALRKG
ncbi:MAG TPA: hypothetical protein PKD58_09545 [Candidatus Sumerlaeota bacterium]|nr:hypothetical protein [Candidatus Sumerlaeota bacterium]HMZ50914.1 hypothetical protein [Candidatus Sumerlaeota bacterium]HNM45857.1 hypothetical protein [Candidatus Sumerlaeota bacterium]